MMSLFVEKSPLVFFVLTVVIGGGAAWFAGRALAMGWRPAWQLIIYMALLGFALRFFHFALFDAKLLSLHYYLSHTLVLIILAGLGYRITQTTRMVTQYPWDYERAGPLSWRDRQKT